MFPEPEPPAAPRGRNELNPALFAAHRERSKRHFRSRRDAKIFCPSCGAHIPQEPTR